MGVGAASRRTHTGERIGGSRRAFLLCLLVAIFNRQVYRPPMRHERLINEATQAAAQRLLDQLPADQRQALEAPVHEAIREGILHYANGLATLSRQLRPLANHKGRA
jgi:hypothetical protein